MKFPIFASFIVFSIWLMYELNKSKKKASEALEAFWERENQANNVRRKSLEHLDYVEIPYDKLPFHLLPDNPAAAEAMADIQSLREEKIVNLTGITNTDLKFAYGPANLPALTAYDENYTTFACAISKWGKELFRAGHWEEGAFLLELGIASGTDISTNYRLLYAYYASKQDETHIKWLRDKAEGLNSAMKNPIIRLLWGDAQKLESPDLYND